MRYTTLLALLIGVMLYLVMGALVFRTLEAPKEITAYQDLVKTKEKFLDNKSCLTEQDLQKLVKVSHYYSFVHRMYMKKGQSYLVVM